MDAWVGGWCQGSGNETKEAVYGCVWEDCKDKMRGRVSVGGMEKDAAPALCCQTEHSIPDALSTFSTPLTTPLFYPVKSLYPVSLTEEEKLWYKSLGRVPRFSKSCPSLQANKQHPFEAPLSTQRRFRFVVALSLRVIREQPLQKCFSCFLSHWAIFFLQKVFTQISFTTGKTKPSSFIAVAFQLHSSL